MSASMWRMNGSRRGMALALVLCALLLHNGVVCDEDADPTDAPADPTPSPQADSTDTLETLATVTAVMDPTDSPLNTASSEAVPADTQGTTAMDPAALDTAITPAPSTADSAETRVVLGTVPSPDDVHDSAISTQTTVGPVMIRDDGTSGTTNEPLVVVTGKDILTTNPPVVPVDVEPTTEAPPVLVLPVVECVDMEAMKDRDLVKIILEEASDCESTKSKIESLPGTWCTTSCKLQVFQDKDSKEVLIASSDTSIKELAWTLHDEDIRVPLGFIELEVKTQSKTTHYVLPTLLTLGLGLAAIIIGGYFLKNRRRHNAKGMRLAEDSYPADEENQGNTLVSVAPLTPPETQEKPSINGESPDGAKTQPPPTNGHSTTKTPVADTEL